MAYDHVIIGGGDPYSGACTIDQFFVWRPFAGSVQHHAAIQSLCDIKGSTHLGRGLGG